MYIYYMSKAISICYHRYKYQDSYFFLLLCKKNICKVWTFYVSAGCYLKINKITQKSIRNVMKTMKWNVTKFIIGTQLAVESELRKRRHYYITDRQKPLVYFCAFQKESKNFTRLCTHNNTFTLNIRTLQQFNVSSISSCIIPINCFIISHSKLLLIKCLNLIKVIPTWTFWRPTIAQHMYRA